MDCDAIFLGIDFGTGGCKVTAISETGVLQGEASTEYVTEFAHPGWSEQDPADWYSAMRASLKKLRDGGHDFPWWKIYRMILKKDLLMSVPDSAVIVTEHHFDDRKAAVVAVNCSDEEKNVSPEIGSGWKIEKAFGDGDFAEGKLHLPAGGGMLFMMSR